MTERKGAELARLITGQVFLHASMAGMRMAAPLLALRAGYSEAAVGVLLALFALTQVFLALPAGRYADRHGLRRPFGWSVLAATIGGAVAVAFPVFPALCAAALLTGGATGAASIALQRHVGRAAEGPTQLKQVFSWLAIGPAFSNFLGPFAAGVAIDHGGFRLAFALVGVLPLVGWFWVRGAKELPPVQVPPGSRPGTAWDLLGEPMFRRLLLVNWLLSSCWDVHTFVVPVLGHERGLSASVIGSILGAFAIAAVSVRLVMPIMAARLKEWAVIMASMAATALLFTAYPLLHAPLAMGACSVLLGVALGTVQPMIMSTLHQITPEHRHGQAVGLRLMAINASSVAMPMLFGAAGAVIGIAGVFWTVAAVVAGGTRLASGLREADAAHSR
ncbi:MAG TPA: MFS transporter [Ramlibacter sp.]|jgi:MFS family permease|uniref:MFS transporter n=1 Tax=Ramlibacter sp. TaxID=1917967 RepID=UPI002D2AC364|nr:MFS transporter [Ramlibacter sp.]HZY19428.1 MFS transporter [Ramlibacter sp.]